MTSEQVEAHFKRQELGILPVGSIEARGPFLPSSTGGLIAQTFAETLGEKTGALVLPLVAYGYCPTTESLPATLSMGAESLFTYLKNVDNSYKEHAPLLASLEIVGVEIEHRLPKASQDPIPSTLSRVPGCVKGAF